MKICWKGFGSPTHSWGNVATNISSCLKNLGNEVHICSTNGYEGFPENLRDNIACTNCGDEKTRNINNCTLDKDFDLGLSYTAAFHFTEFLQYAKVKFGIWNFDGTKPPFVKDVKNCDLFLPSSKLSFDVFANSGISKDKMVVVPHGYNEDLLDNSNFITFDTDKRLKIFVNIQQAHTRKNIPNLLNVIGKTFTNKDDICIIFKVKIKKPSQIFEISFMDELIKAKKKFRNFPEHIILNHFVDNIFDIYKSVDIIFSMSNIEMFHLPSLEGMVSGKLVIGSNWGGNVDFMNADNSLLIDGKIVRCPANYSYWKASTYGEMFEPNIEDACAKLKNAVDNYDTLLEKFYPEMLKIKQKYTWNNVAKQIVNLHDDLVCSQ